jgi:antitoxin HigA-1
MISYPLRLYPLWFRPIVLLERMLPFEVLTAAVQWWQENHRCDLKVPSVGEVLDNEYLIPMNLAEEDLAEKMGISNEAVYDLLDKDNVLDETLAKKLDEVFHTDPGYWMRLQRKRAEYLMARFGDAL